MKLLFPSDTQVFSWRGQFLRCCLQHPQAKSCHLGLMNQLQKGEKNKATSKSEFILFIYHVCTCAQPQSWVKQVFFFHFMNNSLKTTDLSVLFIYIAVSIIKKKVLEFDEYKIYKGVLNNYLLFIWYKKKRTKQLSLPGLCL